MGRRTPSTTWLDAKRAVAMTDAARPARSLRIASRSEAKSKLAWTVAVRRIISRPRVPRVGKYARITG
jgi:hypothetical protein